MTLATVRSDIGSAFEDMSADGLRNLMIELSLRHKGPFGLAHLPSAFNALSRQERDVLYLHYVERMAIGNIGTYILKTRRKGGATGVSHTRVSLIRSAALDALATKLKGGRINDGKFIR